MARVLDDSLRGRPDVGPRDVGDAVRGSVADALAGKPPTHDVRIDRLRVRVPPGAGADAVGRAIAHALERAVRERGGR